MAAIIRKHGTGNWFDDLPLYLRVQAQRTFSRLCARWGRDLPQWRRAILVSRARWLVLHPPDSAWGRSMLAKRGGKARQWQARLEVYPGGRTLQQWAAHVRVQKQRAVRHARQASFIRKSFTDMRGI